MGNVKQYEHRGRALVTINSDNKEYPLEIRVATEKGYQEMKNNGVCDLSYPSSKLRRARVQGDGGDICPSLTCSGTCLYVITIE